MKRFCSGILMLVLSIWTISCSEVEAGTEKLLFGHNDGPYILYEGNNAALYRLQKGTDSSNFLSESYSINELKTKEIEVYPDSNMDPFYVTLFDYNAEPDFFTSPKKTLVVSDIEGNFIDFVKILTASGVMNDDYSWKYGKNHLEIGRAHV